MMKWIKHFLPPACLLCHANPSVGALLCNACQEDLPWNRISEREHLTLFHYQPPIDHFINQLKFHDQLIYAHFFGQCFISRLKQQATALPDYLLPVPLHRQRLRERGFNQAIEIAKPIAKHFKIPVARDCCRRQKYTKPQSNLSALEREQNVKNAFAMKWFLPAQRVAIIDDVVTTGSTVNELTQLLKNQGIQKVAVWSVARPGKI